MTVVDPAADGFVEDADRFRRFGRQGDGLVGDVTVIRRASGRGFVGMVTGGAGHGRARRDAKFLGARQ